MQNSNYKYQDNLESERLKTRFLIKEDIEPWQEFLGNQECTKYFQKTDMTAEEYSRFWIERQMKRYAEQRFGLQAIIEKETGKFVGQCGLLTQTVDGKEELEVGYHLFEKHWGKGFATEAAKLFIGYAFQNKLAESIISIIEKRNINSQKVAFRNGLILENETKWNGLEVFIFRIHKDNF